MNERCFEMHAIGVISNDARGCVIVRWNW